MSGFIELVKLKMNYPLQHGYFAAINDISLEIKKGSLTSITGRSGSGKSTLLKMLGGILKPTSGKVLIDGEDIYSFSDKKLISFRRRIGFVFQDYLLEDRYTVYQNIEIALMLSDYPVKSRKQKISSLLEEVGLSGKAKDVVMHLSGGEKQRVGVARSLANDPEIILADEPCGNLDHENGRMIMKLLKRQKGKGKTVLLVTHNQEDAKETDRIITLEDGRVLTDEVQ
ncbi:MAG: ABC transporter ATP-binding protein [Lachnospiraceae bacterium]|nr:ABC transporter ATP-binding protein [Lachnospiraceae bacterium]